MSTATSGRAREHRASDGCYICQPDNPHASEEGCGECDRDYHSHVARLAAALEGGSA